MAFTPKAWEDEPDPLGVLQGRVSPTSRTPLDAAAHVDLERRLSTYTDEQVAGTLRLGTSGTTALRGDARAADVGAAAASHTHTASAISDASSVGRSVLTATDAATARSAIGAGTSSLVIGTSNSTAKRGDYTPPADQVAGTSSMRRLGTGANEAAPGASAVGGVIYDGSLSAARPACLICIWSGFPSEPTNRAAGDVWLAPGDAPAPELVLVQAIRAAGAGPGTSALIALGSTATVGSLLVSICTVDKAAGGSGPAASTGWTVIEQESTTSISIAMAWRIANGTTTDQCRWSWTNSQPSHVAILEAAWDGSTPSVRFQLRATEPTAVTSVDLSVTAQGDGFALCAATVDTRTNWTNPLTWTGITAINEWNSNGTDDAPLILAGDGVADGTVRAVRLAAAGGTGDQAAAILATFGRPA